MKYKKLIGLLALWTMATPLLTQATEVPHLLINEIQIAGESATDEFIELYNPTANTIDLTGYKLKKFTSSGSVSNLVSNFPEIQIAAQSYLLVTHPSGYDGTAQSDLAYDTSGSLAANNSLALVDPAGETVDLVGFGEVTKFEGVAATNPIAHQGLTRTNGADTDSNATDFTIRETSDPQSSISQTLASLNIPEATLQNLCQTLYPTVTTTAEAVATPAETTPVPAPATPTTQTTENDPMVVVNNPPAAENQTETTIENTTTEETTETETTTVISYPTGALIITELYSAPQNEDPEWVEIWNATTAAIALSGWKLTDASGAVTDLEGTISQAAYFQILNPKGKLNNTGDTVTLIDPVGNTIDSASYDDTNYGESYARDGGVWFASTTPTPLASNVITGDEAITEYLLEEGVASGTEQTITTSETTNEASTAEAPVATHVATETTDTETSVAPQTTTDDAQIVSLAEARDLKKGTLIQTTGVVAVPPGIFGVRTFYVAGSGLQVYLHGIEVPTLSIGDVVELQGKLGSTGGETRIVVSKSEGIKIIDHTKAPTAETVELGEIGDEIEGWLISAEGTVVQKLTDRFIVEDSSGSVPVVIKAEAHIDPNGFQIGDTVRITGLVSETSSGFRLLPRGAEDIVMTVAGETLPSEPGQTVQHVSFITIIAGIFVSTLFVMVVRKQIVARRGDDKTTEPTVM